jgi:hypothetical protein
MARVRREKVPHTRQLGKPPLNGRCRSRAASFGISSRGPSSGSTVASANDRRSLAVSRARSTAKGTRSRENGESFPENEEGRGNSADVSGVPLPCTIGWRPVPGEGAPGISNARARVMMLSNSLGWKSWYGMCTKRAIMRPTTSVLALIIWIEKFERVNPTPVRVAS